MGFKSRSPRRPTDMNDHDIDGVNDLCADVEITNWDGDTRRRPVIDIYITKDSADDLSARDARRLSKWFQQYADWKEAR